MVEGTTSAIVTGASCAVNPGAELWKDSTMHHQRSILLGPMYATTLCFMPEKLRAMVERSRHNTYELWFSVGLLVLSIYGLIRTAPASSTLDRSLDDVLGLAYSLVGLFGAAFTLIGMRIRNAFGGLYLEALGQIAVGGGGVTFVVVLALRMSFNESGLVMMTGSMIALGALSRVWQIRGDLRREREVHALRIEVVEALDQLDQLTHEVDPERRDPDADA